MGTEAAPNRKPFREPSVGFAASPSIPSEVIGLFVPCALQGMEQLRSTKDERSSQCPERSCCEPRARSASLFYQYQPLLSESYLGLGDLGTTHCLPFSLGTLQPPRLRVSRPFSRPPHPPPSGSTGREGSQKQTVVWMCSKEARR